MTIMSTNSRHRDEGALRHTSAPFSSWAETNSRAIARFQHHGFRLRVKLTRLRFIKSGDKDIANDHADGQIKRSCFFFNPVGNVQRHVGSNGNMFSQFQTP